ncbi:hypothetical protein [Streptomyces sp. A012304]|uniref:hypothetical protein n=1 Tax=Streptomyces sp. A012304 TaxID=375446 RepID=UPI002231DCE1|nr:hypothetical protein [Streptomyces sp. A012304]GKQ36670.1 hypothetical protein ALMP_32100 [Streptomyces sp. A012304]
MSDDQKTTTPEATDAEELTTLNTHATIKPLKTSEPATGDTGEVGTDNTHATGEPA